MYEEGGGGGGGVCLKSVGEPVCECVPYALGLYILYIHTGRVVRHVVEASECCMKIMSKCTLRKHWNFVH